MHECEINRRWAIRYDDDEDDDAMSMRARPPARPTMTVTVDDE